MSDVETKKKLSKVEVIKRAFAECSIPERDELLAWFSQWEDDAWDRQMAADAAAGKFDKILREVDEDIRSGRLEDGP